MVDRLRSLGLKSQVTKGEERIVVESLEMNRFSRAALSVFPGVESVTPILAPWKIVSREFQKQDSVIDVGGVSVGRRPSGGDGRALCRGKTGNHCWYCQISLLNQTRILQGGAYKPRTSPIRFRGWVKKGLEFWRRPEKKPIACGK